MSNKPFVVWLSQLLPSDQWLEALTEVEKLQRLSRSLGRRFVLCIDRSCALPPKIMAWFDQVFLYSRWTSKCLKNHNDAVDRCRAPNRFLYGKWINGYRMKKLMRKAKPVLQRT